MKYQSLLLFWCLGITAYSYPRMRSKHHDGKIQGDFLPPDLHGLVAQLHCHTQESGDSSAPYTGIWGTVSGQGCLASCWLCLALQSREPWGEPAPAHPWNEGDGNSPGAEHLRIHTDSLTRGKYKAVFRIRCLSTNAKQPQTLHSHMDPSATIQIYVHGIS